MIFASSDIAWQETRNEKGNNDPSFPELDGIYRIGEEKMCMQNIEYIAIDF
jgi:hypothetical protein